MTIGLSLKGNPVVSTLFPELLHYLDVVYQANTPAEFAECIKKALAEETNELVAARRKKSKRLRGISKHSWCWKNCSARMVKIATCLMTETEDYD